MYELKNIKGAVLMTKVNVNRLKVYKYPDEHKESNKDMDAKSEKNEGTDARSEENEGADAKSEENIWKGGSDEEIGKEGASNEDIEGADAKSEENVWEGGSDEENAWESGSDEDNGKEGASNINISYHARVVNDFDICSTHASGQQISQSTIIRSMLSQLLTHSKQCCFSKMRINSITLSIKGSFLYLLS